jgi:Tol biopolymer transport system component
VIKADGTKEHALGSATGEWPRFSPNGAKIVYGSGGDIRVMRANGTNDHTISVGGNSYYPDWSPNGKRIAYFSGATIWVMNADGSHATAVSAADASWGPSWSPNGKKLAYPSSSNQVIVMGSGGTNPTPIGAMGECCIAWAPR